MTHLGAALAGAAAGGLAAAEGGGESAALGRTAPAAGNPGAGLGPPTAPAGLGPCRPLYNLTSPNPAGSASFPLRCGQCAMGRLHDTCHLGLTPVLVYPPLDLLHEAERG